MPTTHPGFKAVQQKIEGEGYSKNAAGAILAKKSRNASAKAKAANPRLKSVKGSPKPKFKSDAIASKMLNDRDSDGM